MPQPSEAAADVAIIGAGPAGLTAAYLLTKAGHSVIVIEKDPEGRTIPGGEHERVPAERGDDLVLTIDRSMQYETE